MKATIKRVIPIMNIIKDLISMLTILHRIHFDIVAPIFIYEKMNALS